MKRALLLSALSLSLVCVGSRASNIAFASLDLSKMDVSFVQGTGSFNASRGYTYTGSRIVTYDYGGGNFTYQAQDYAGSESKAYWVGNSTSASANMGVLAARSIANNIGTNTGSMQSNSYADWVGSVNLEPGSTAEFRVAYEISGRAIANNVNSGDELASGQVSLTAYQDPSDPRSFVTASAVGYAYPNGKHPDFSENGILDLVLQNSTTSSQQYFFRAGASAFAVTSVTDIPEPKSAALVLLGLGLLALPGRRRIAAVHNM